MRVSLGAAVNALARQVEDVRRGEFSQEGHVLSEERKVSQQNGGTQRQRMRLFTNKDLKDAKARDSTTKADNVS